MQIKNLFRPFIIAVTFVFSLIACNTPEKKDDKIVAEEHNDAKFNKAGEKDAQIMVEAYSDGLYEIRMADSASLYGTTASTKSMSAMLGEEHRKLNGELQALAARKQISLPVDITSSQLGDLAGLRNERRADFDRKYSSIVMAKHKEAVMMYEKSSTDCTDPDIKAWFASALPELRKHMDMVMSNDAKNKGAK